MPDHPMTPHPFREALDNLVWAASMLQGSASPLLLRARAEVERLYAARVGEEYEVVPAWAKGGLAKVDVSGSFVVGDRVYVTKGEAG